MNDFSDNFYQRDVPESPDEITREKIMMELVKVGFAPIAKNSRGSAVKISALRMLALMQGFIEPDLDEVQRQKTKTEFDNLSPEQQKALFDKKIAELEDDAL